MIYEIATPYDAKNTCDVYESLPELFSALAEIVEPDATSEIYVYRWESWEERESGKEEGNEEEHVILFVDDWL